MSEIVLRNLCIAPNRQYHHWKINMIKQKVECLFLHLFKIHRNNFSACKVGKNLFNIFARVEYLICNCIIQREDFYLCL